MQHCKQRWNEDFTTGLELSTIKEKSSSFVKELADLGFSLCTRANLVNSLSLFFGDSLRFSELIFFGCQFGYNAAHEGWNIACFHSTIANFILSRNFFFFFFELWPAASNWSRDSHWRTHFLKFSSKRYHLFQEKKTCRGGNANEVRMKRIYMKAFNKPGSIGKKLAKKLRFLFRFSLRCRSYISPQ